MSKQYFQHYKGGVYERIAHAKHSETEEDLVVYVSCETGQVWVRPLSMFYDTKPGLDGEQVLRFRHITVQEKNALLNWRKTPCPGTGRQPREEDVLRQPDTSAVIMAHGRAKCSECGHPNVGWTVEAGMNPHKPQNRR